MDHSFYYRRQQGTMFQHDNGNESDSMIIMMIALQVATPCWCKKRFLMSVVEFITSRLIHLVTNILHHTPTTNCERCALALCRVPEESHNAEEYSLTWQRSSLCSTPACYRNFK